MRTGRSSPPSSGSESAERPHKRQRVDSCPAASQCRQLLLEEIDLEIALQERLAATVQSRVTWALLLQQAVQNDLGNAAINSFGFRDAALDALAAIEAPCEVLFTREVQPNPNLRPSLPPTPSAAPQIESIQIPSAYSTRNRALHRSARPPARKLLFLRNTSTFPPQIVKLACPDCSRTDFSSLQGLLNHCRLGHKREFGSHDDCVQSCAVLVDDPEDQAWVVANGAEVTGVSLPGLRRLFELAVGGGLGLLPTPIPLQKKEQPAVPEQATPAEQNPLHNAAEPLEELVSHVTRTLGHHADSPALAQFLGRAPKKRRIHSYNEDQAVDVFGFDHTISRRSLWRKPYSHRSNARATLDEVSESSELSKPIEAAEHQPVPEPTPSSETLHALKSRFHIAARVSIRDISRWIPPARRVESELDHTHRWRLAVTSPTYSLPISSFLKKVAVTCLTDPPPSTMTEPIILDHAPFFVTSTTDRPFLARLTFTWTGSEGQNPPMDVDHWVELDPFHLSNPVLGDEQFFDVELDRNTELLPEQDDSRFDAWDFSDTPNAHGSKKVEETADATPEPDYVAKLKSLLPQVPMTLKDVKGKLSRQPPYTLVSTPAQYRNLLYGRRKALEWARARALRQAYNDLCSSSEPKDGQAHVSLTTVDILHWLEDEGQFPRSTTFKSPTLSISNAPRRKQPIVKTEENAPDAETYCRYCGLHCLYHPSAATLSEQSTHSPNLDTNGVKLEPTIATVPSASISSACISFCGKTTEISYIDVNRLPMPLEPSMDIIQSEYPTHTLRSGAQCSMASHDLVAAADPKLTIGLRELCASWKLDNLPSMSGPGLSSFTVTLAGMNRSRDEIERDMAPFALLSLLTKSVTKALIQGGLEEYRRDESGIRTLGFRHRNRKNVQVKRLLTPSHIVRGLVHGASQFAGSSLLSVFAPLGISLPVIPEADVPASGGAP